MGWNTSANTPGVVWAVGRDGMLKWNFTTGRDDDPITLGPDGTFLVHGSEDHSLVSLRSDGSVKWNTKSRGDVLAGGRSIDKDGTVYIIPRADYPFSGSSYLAALNGEDGSILFNTSLTINGEEDVEARPVLGLGGLVYVNGLQGDKAGTCVVRAFHRNGTEAWVRPSLGALVTQTSFDGKHDVLYMVTGNSVVALSGDVGAVLWEANVSSTGLSRNAVIGEDGNTIYLWDSGDDESNSVYAVR